MLLLALALPGVALPTTAVGNSLLPLLNGPKFPAAWRSALNSLGGDDAAAAAPPPAAAPESDPNSRVDALLRQFSESEKADVAPATLQQRIKEQQTTEERGAVLHDLLHLAACRTFVDDDAALIKSLDVIAPGAAWPSDAVNLDKVLSLLPADAAAQADAYIRAAVPAADATISGSFDRKSAAQLYMGCAQFGYFVSTFVRGVVLESDDAEGVANALKLASRQMRSEAAFVVASTRAGTLFELEREDASMGYEALREFTTRVQPISSAQKSEFYAEESGGAADAASAAAASGGGGGGGGSALPTPELVSFNCAALQALLSEGVLYGWVLWEAETEVCTALPEKTSVELFKPPATAASFDALS